MDVHCKVKMPKAVVTEEIPPLIPEGCYEGSLGDCELFTYKGGEKLCLSFIIQAPDTALNGVIIKRFYNWYKRKTSRSWDFLRDYERVLGRHVDVGDEISPEFFKGKVLKLYVRTVSVSIKNRILPQFQKYSVVDYIEGFSREMTRSDLPF